MGDSACRESLFIRTGILRGHPLPLPVRKRTRRRRSHCSAGTSSAGATRAILRAAAGGSDAPGARASRSRCVPRAARRPAAGRRRAALRGRDRGSRDSVRADRGRAYRDRPGGITDSRVGKASMAADLLRALSSRSRSASYPAPAPRPRRRIAARLDAERTARCLTCTCSVLGRCRRKRARDARDLRAA